MLLILYCVTRRKDSLVSQPPFSSSVSGGQSTCSRAVAGQRSPSAEKQSADGVAPARAGSRQGWGYASDALSSEEHICFSHDVSIRLIKTLGCFPSRNIGGQSALVPNEASQSTHSLGAVIIHLVQARRGDGGPGTHQGRAPCSPGWKPEMWPPWAARDAGKCSGGPQRPVTARRAGLGPMAASRPVVGQRPDGASDAW